MSPPTGNAEGTDFQRGGYDQWSLGRICHSIFVVHEATVDNRIILEDNLVAVATFQALLVAVALVRAILHLLEIPDHTKFAHSCH